MFRTGKIKLNPQINLPINLFNWEIFLPWHSYLEYKLLGVCIPSRYSEYLLMVKIIRQKKRVGNKRGIDPVSGMDPGNNYRKYGIT